MFVVKRNLSFVQHVVLSFIILMYITFVILISQMDNTNLLSYGNVYFTDYQKNASNMVLQCKPYSKLKLMLSNDVNLTISDSILPSVCLKRVQNVLHWTIHPTNCTKDVFLIWLIKSSIYRNTLRRNIRKFWGQDISYVIDGQSYRTRRVFLIGSDLQNSSMPAVQLENQIYNDILQGSFTDTFKSVSQKVVLGMNFVRDHCSSIHYAVIVDDDATVVPWNLLQHLPLASNLTDGQYFGGFFLHGKSPIRDPKKRWYVPVTDYRCKRYPTYPLGTGFFMAKCTLDQLYESVLKLYLFGMDDVLFGGLALELGIKITEIDFKNRYSECGALIKAHKLLSLKDMVICHGTDYPHDQELLWSELCHAPISNPNFARYNLQYCKTFL